MTVPPNLATTRYYSIVDEGAAKNLTPLFSGALVAQRKGHPVEGRQARNVLELMVKFIPRSRHSLGIALCQIFLDRILLGRPFVVKTHMRDNAKKSFLEHRLLLPQQ